MKDTGIGISEEKVNLIFNEFQQGDGSISRRYGGTGLGLSISKKLAELMNGEIKLHSILGMGSEFILYIPELIDKHNTSSAPSMESGDEVASTVNQTEELANQAELLLNKTEESEKSRNSEASMASDHTSLHLEGKTILIVDDDPRNVYSIASILEEFNAEIIEADNGIEAVKRLKREKADLILMDIMMPEMDGYETMKKIRMDPELKSIPIIAITANALKEDRERCIAAGADDYISKPIDYHNLIKLISAWI